MVDGSGSGSGIPERIVSWRIEINRRKRRSGHIIHHWIYRLTLSSGKRRSRYGGMLTTLPDPARLKQYRRNSRRHARRKQHE